MKNSAGLIILFTLFVLTPSMSAQTLMDSLNTNIRVDRSYKLDMLQERFNKTDRTKGYRIQIHSGLRSEEARKMKSKFLNAFPESTCYESYKQPYFNVKVGDFMTKLEAQHFLNMMRGDFPNSFIVPDFIDPLQLSKKNP